MGISDIRNTQLYYQQDQRTPVTKLTVVFIGAGEQKETDLTIGLGRITAQLLFHGTSKYTRDDIQAKFDLLGATVSAHVNEMDFTISISCFSRTLPEVMDLIVHIITECIFPLNELDILKRHELNRIQSILQNNDEVLRMVNRYILFAKTHIGRIGSKKSLEKITGELVQQYFEKVRSSHKIYCTAISDLPKQTVESLLSRFISGRPTDGFRPDPEMEYRTINTRNAVIVDLPDAPNDRLMWSQSGIDATDPRRFALQMILDALGSFEGFLFDQLRNKNGWCYGIYAFQLPPSNRKGLIGYYSDPSESTSQFLIPALIDLLDTFHSHADYLKRFSERNAAFKNRFAYQHDLKYKLASQVNRDRYGIPILSKEEYFSEIDKVTNEFALQVIGELFDSQKLSMVFYGQADRISSILHKIDSTITVEILQKSQLID